MVEQSSSKVSGPTDVHTAAAVDAVMGAVYYAYSCGVEGDIAEFGTMTGTTAEALAIAISKYEKHKSHWVKTKKSLHLFDSFKGLPRCDNDFDRSSVHVVSGMWGEGSCSGLSAKQLKKTACTKMEPERVFLHEGWFADTLVEFKQLLGVVHIDSDLYSSARDVLNALFSCARISQGAMVLFDDWNCNLARPDMGERRAWGECVEKYRVEFSDEGGYGFMSHKFIVHSYQGGNA